MTKALSIVLGGGKGTRLYPLTKDRAKPAVPFGGKYRLVDIPISNCINANLRRIYILTQFNSASLHMHISHTYNFDSFSGGFVEILAAEQTFDHSGWYEGTADAVRKNFPHFRTQNPSHYIILSGDQLYSMDPPTCSAHIESAEVSIARTAVNRQDATALGILKADAKGRITEFIEKPKIDYDLPPSGSRPNPSMQEGQGVPRFYGNYIFDAIWNRALITTFRTSGRKSFPWP